MNGRVLIVEDDQLLSEWLGAALRSKGLQVLLASSFEEAKQKLEMKNSPPIHAVVSDIFIGSKEAEGLRIAKECRRMGLPCAIMTSKASLEIAKESLNDGAFCFLEKPFKIEDLIRRLEAVWDEPPFLGVILQRFVEKHALTEKEAEVCQYLFKGMSNQEIASLLNVSEKTIKFHVSGIFAKCEVKSRAELLSTVFPV